jgi:hypothetical protein
MTRGTQSGAKRAGPASKAQGCFWGGARKKVQAFFAGTLFWEEPGKQRPAAPQNRGPRRMVFVRWGDGTPGEPRARARVRRRAHAPRERPNGEESTVRKSKRTSRRRSSRGPLAEGDQGIAERQHGRIPVIAAPGDGRLQPDGTGKRFRDNAFATQAACRAPDQTDVPMKGHLIQRLNQA